MAASPQAAGSQSHPPTSRSGNVKTDVILDIRASAVTRAAGGASRPTGNAQGGVDRHAEGGA
jgi:hypothetical protein